MNRQRIFGIGFFVFCLLFFSACCVLSTKFETLPSSTKYHVGDTFSDNGMTFECVEFHLSPTDIYLDGFAEVSTMNRAGGSGQEIYVGNLNLKFDLADPIDHLFIDVGHWGGTVNLEINGTLEIFNDINYINGRQVAGVTVTTLGGYNNPGLWEFTGTITSFVIGGQEFGMDNICVK